MDRTAAGGTGFNDNSLQPNAIEILTLRRAWAGLVADLRLIIENSTVTAVPNSAIPQIPADGSWLKVVGNGNSGNFDLFMPAVLLDLIFKKADENLDLGNIQSIDAAIILEHIFTERLEALEAIFGQKLTFEYIEMVEQVPAGSALGFDVKVDAISYPAALTAQGQLFQALKQIVERNSNPQELELDPKMTVHFGPVVVPSKTAYQSAVGGTIDCGVTPNQNITGVLMRSDGRYWPVQIEDEVIKIAGELAPPVDFSKTQADRVFATFVIGTIELDAFQRGQIQNGTTLPVNRFADNKTDVYFQNRHYASGHLKILNENLAVQIDMVGSNVAGGK